MKQIALLLLVGFLMAFPVHRTHAQAWPEFMLEEDDLSAEWHLFAKKTITSSNGLDVWQITWYKGISTRELFSLQVYSLTDGPQATEQFNLLEMSHSTEGWKNITSTSFEGSGFTHWFARTAYEAHRECIDQVVDFYFVGQYGRFLVAGGHTDVATYRWSDIKTVVEAQLAKLTLIVTEGIASSDALRSAETQENGPSGVFLIPMLLALGLIGIRAKKRRKN
ncbi:MAG: hypothetical protein ACXAB4_04850 [Candidatus Hodarchaeales archaeon]|jgi:hypothetical protein